MENASKALLIAGAILIVILLIGIGMLIYSRSTGVVDIAAGTMSAQEIQAFNSQFTPYEGNQRGSSIRAMISTVIANNAAYDTSSPKFVRIINSTGVQGMSGGAQVTNENMAELSSKINTQVTYPVTFNYTDGLISQITIGAPET